MSTDAVKWNKRASLLYAVGVWTMFGSYAYYTYRHKDVPRVEMPKKEEDTRPNMKKIETPYVSTTIVYKEHFVPYSSRFLNLFRHKEDSPSGSQANEKKG